MGTGPLVSRPLAYERSRQTAHLSALRRESEHDVEARGQLAGVRLFNRREIDNHGLANFGIENALEDRVALVARVPLDITLRSEFLLAFHSDGEVNMRRAARVGNRLDGAEQVFAR